LHLPTLPLDQLFDQKGSNCIARILLLGIGLDDNSTVHLWRMIVLVFRGVIWVNGVPHVRRHQERARDGLCERPCSGRKPMKQKWYQGRLRARRRDATDLLMIEEGDAIDIAANATRLILRQGFDSTPATKDLSDLEREIKKI
jgi:hypothetical protein